jgi:predicted DCC family thiol-disulfide oxidoreductase YuxK
MGKLLALDPRRALRPIALQDPASDALLPDGMSEEDKMRSWHLVEDDGRVRSGGRAFAPLLAQLPAGRALARLTDRAYYAVADRRSLWGRFVTAKAKARARARIAAHHLP